MNVGLVAHDGKKNLMQNLCIAYQDILKKHKLYATSTTGQMIEDVANLKIHKLLEIGRDKQFMAMIERNAMDLVILFHNPNMTSPKEPNVYQIASCCDQYNIPCATNLPTAEVLILALDRGDLDWRNMYK